MRVVTSPTSLRDGNTISINTGEQKTSSPSNGNAWQDKCEERDENPAHSLPQHDLAPPALQYLVHPILRDPIFSREIRHADALGVPGTDLRIAIALLTGSW